MAADRYILPAYDENGQLQEVELDTIGSGYTGLAVFDSTGAEHEIASSPASSPPTGQLPVLDSGGTTHLIAFQIAAVTGIYELTANAINALVSQTCDDTLQCSYAFENAPFEAQNPTDFALWAESLIDFGSHEVLAFSGEARRYRLRGQFMLRLYCGLQIGTVPLVTAAGLAVAQFRYRSMSPVQTFDAWHTPIQRDGAWWTCEVRCDFRSDRDFDR